MGEQLPPKFLLSAHSFGGYQFHLYASAHPERVQAVFFQSPASTEFYDSSDVDPYQIRLQDDTNTVPSKKQVDQGIRDLENLVVPM
jgi:pimeloyl-ACP methyl ester carboxylesterase